MSVPLLYSKFLLLDLLEPTESRSSRPAHSPRVELTVPPIWFVKMKRKCHA